MIGTQWSQVCGSGSRIRLFLGAGVQHGLKLLHFDIVAWLNRVDRRGTEGLKSEDQRDTARSSESRQDLEF